MIKLYGLPLSNYYNIVKLALLEKGVAFEEVQVRLGSGDYLEKSPAGKVPCIETKDGFLSETNVILEYLEDLGEGPALLPADAFARAKVRELMKVLELYIELPARTLYPEAFMGRSVSDAQKEAARDALRKGFDAVKALARFEPYIAGTELTYADLYAQFTIGLATRVTKAVYGWDSLGELPGLKALFDRIGQRETTQRVVHDQRAAMAQR